MSEGCGADGEIPKDPSLIADARSGLEVAVDALIEAAPPLVQKRQIEPPPTVVRIGSQKFVKSLLGFGVLSRTTKPQRVGEQLLQSWSGLGVGLELR